MADIGLTHSIPPNGLHDAQIEVVEVLKGATTFVRFRYHLQVGGKDFSLWERLPIAAKKDSPANQNTWKGKERVSQILKAFGLPLLETMHPQEVEDALTGREVLIEVGSYFPRGSSYATPVVNKVVGKARNPVPSPVA
jgi:hypothetical protein